MGFKLESVLLLKETKKKPKKRTKKVKSFLDYIIKTVKQQNHELLLFVKDMPSLEKIEDVSLVTLKGNMEHDKKNYKFLKKEIGIALKIERKKEHTVKRKMCVVFLQNYFKFCKMLNVSTKKCKKNLEETENVVKDTMLYYGEKYPDITAQDFFSIINQIIDNVKQNKIFIE